MKIPNMDRIIPTAAITIGAITALNCIVKLSTGLTLIPIAVRFEATKAVAPRAAV
jgi:hypothetical protein